MGTASLVERFSKAGLPLELAATPIVRGAGDIVQMDITRRRTRHAHGERFLIFPGHEANRIEVEGVDRDERQLVLMVHEPRRRFEVEIGRWTVPTVPVIRREGPRRWVEQFTTEAKRHFLLGMDEQHLFIAQLPRGVSSVRGARESLKGAAVRKAEQAAGGSIRQGEWFFFPLDRAHVAKLDALAARFGAPLHRRRGIAEAAGWARAGRPHVADEILVVRDPRSEVIGTWVRGAVRHPDHATLELREWHGVLGNDEVNTRVAGVNWVD